MLPHGKLNYFLSNYEQSWKLIFLAQLCDATLQTKHSQINLNNLV